MLSLLVSHYLSISFLSSPFSDANTYLVVLVLFIDDLGLVNWSFFKVRLYQIWLFALLIFQKIAIELILSLLVPLAPNLPNRASIFSKLVGTFPRTKADCLVQSLE